MEGRSSSHFRLVEGLDIRAVEGVVIPQYPARGWAIAERKSRNVYKLANRDIVIGLVRPERRNIGFLLDYGGDILGSPDGIAVVRVKPDMARQYPQEWLFAVLRSEACRLQFWTESGGTSYGKLTTDHISGVLLPIPTDEEIKSTAEKVRQWAKTVETSINTWDNIGSEEDRKPIRNSAIIGLESDED